MRHHDKVIPRPTGRGWLALLAGAALVGACVGWVGSAKAETTDTVGAIHAAAQNNGVPVAPLLALAACESRFVPSARGDHGRSHGLYQLNDLPTGLLHHFREVNYSDPYDAEQASDYVARVSRGDWAKQGVTLARWTCSP